MELSRKGYWLSKTNQRIFFDSAAKLLNVKKPQDWGQIHVNQVKEIRGSAFLRNCYNSNLIKALQSTYPEISWDEKWFIRSRGYWKKKENQFRFLKSIEKYFNITHPSDWKNITQAHITLRGGKGLYNVQPNLYSALKENFPDINWNKEWFKKRTSYDFWNSTEKQRQFIETFAFTYNIKNISDWQRVSITLFKKNGGQGLLSRYNKSLHDVLSVIYPNYNAEEQRISFPQSSVCSNLQNMFFVI